MNTTDHSPAAPAVSVIIPSYKVRGYIGACVRSAFNQTLHEPYEIIVVDDCDPDASVEEVQAMEGDKPAHVSLRYLRHERNRGLSAARNTGTDAALADYVLYVDSDDELYPHALQTLLEEARRTGADVTVGVTRQAPPLYNKVVRNHSCGVFRGREAFDTYMGRKIDMTAWNKLVRKDFLAKHGIRFREGFIHEDEIWSVDLLLAGVTYACLEVEPTYFYRTVRSGSIMAAPDLDRLGRCIRYCNMNAAAFDAAGYGAEPLVRKRFADDIAEVLEILYTGTPRKGMRGAWAMCSRLAKHLLQVSPVLRRCMKGHSFPPCRHLSRLLALPWGPRQPALLLYLLYLSKRISPATQP